MDLKKVTGLTSTMRTDLETWWPISLEDTGRFSDPCKMLMLTQNLQQASESKNVDLIMSSEQELSGELSSSPASPLIKAGHSVAIINYTRAPKQNLQDMQTQVIISFLFGCNLWSKTGGKSRCLAS